MSKIVSAQEVPVWITNEFLDPKDLRSMDDATIVDRLTTYHSDMSQHGWIQVGEAEITITLKSDDEMVNSQIATLRVKKAEVQAEALKKLEEYEHRIQQLLALPAPEPEDEFPF